MTVLSIRILASVFSLAGLAALAVGCSGGGSEGPGDVKVSLSEWAIGVPAQLDPGDATLVVTNAGGRPHELVLIKSDLPLTMLPILDDKVDESKLQVVGRVEVIGPADVSELGIGLSPGKYTLICNIVERPPGAAPVSHFDQGMAAAVVVGE